MKHLLKAFAMLITLSMLLALVGCAKETSGENTDDPRKSVTITHIPVLEEKIYANASGYPQPNSLKNLFAVTYNVVRGKILSHEEIKATYTYESGLEVNNYSSLYSMRVEHVYGENEMKYFEDDIIRFITNDSSNDAYPEELTTSIKVSGEYIIFLRDIRDTNRPKEYEEYAEYAAAMLDWCALTKNVSGYEAKLMQFVESENTNGNYTLKEIEQVIFEHINADYVNTMSIREMMIAQMNGQS